MVKPREKKYDRQNKLAADRQLKYRQRMTEEQKEEYRRKARERYNKRKAEKNVKSIVELNTKEQKEKRKMWKRNSKRYRDNKKKEKEAVSLTPPMSDEEDIDQQLENPSRQQIVGRKKIRKDKAKAYRDLIKKDGQIKELERKLAKYKKRLQREKEKAKCGLNVSPSPAKKVREVVGSKKVTPEVKKRLFLGFALEKQLKSNLKGVSPKTKVKQIMLKSVGSKILRKYRIQRDLKSIVPYTFNKYDDVTSAGDILKYTRQKYSTVAVKEAKLIQKFYEDDTVSKMCPGKKDVVRKGPIRKQRRILLDSLQNLYKRFVEDYGQIKVSESTFKRVRPFWVTPPNSRDRETCACMTHTNMELLVAGLRNAKVIKHGNLNDLVESAVCATNNKLCMTGVCSVCRDKSIEYTIGPDVEMKFFKWVRVTETRNIKGVEKKITFTTKQPQICHPSSIKSHFLKSLSIFKKHVFNLRHQAQEYKNVKQNLKEGELIFQVDFSQNYVAKYDKEIQSAHFGASKRQISLHTGLLYSFDPNADKVKQRTFCTVSDNLDHNSYSVWAHMKPILQEVSMSFPNTHTIHFFSDSPSSQYRNRANIYLMKKLLPHYFSNLKSFTWNYSEPGHGKGAMDGVGGSLKRCADFEVKHGKDITNATDLVSTLGKKSKTKLVVIPSAEIEHAKNSLPLDIPPIKGIMGLRQVTYGRLGMFGRRLSCFKCRPDEKCTHFPLVEIFPESSTKLHFPSSSKTKFKPVKKSETLKVDQVYTSSDDSEEEGKLEGVPTTTTLNKVFSAEELKQGTFVVVQIKSSNKKESFKNFVGVVNIEMDNEEELKITFMKSTGADRCEFFANNSDTSYVHVNDVVGILPHPKIVQKGLRIYYKFEGPVNL